MSEHGTFATERTWCKACHDVIGRVLREGLCEPSWAVHEHVFLMSNGTFHSGMWIGSVRETYAGGEIHVFGDEINPVLERALCHPLRLVVFAENGDNMVFSLLPIGHMVETLAQENTPTVFPPSILPDGVVPATVPVSSLGHALDVEHRVESLREVAYQIPMYINAEGALVCETRIAHIPCEQQKDGVHV